MLSLSEAKEQLNITSAVHDSELGVFVDAATKVVERYTGRAVVAAEVTERHRVSGEQMLRLFRSPVTALGSIVGPVYTWDTANLDLDTDAGIVTVLSGPLFGGLLTVTYTAGYTDVPENYNLAARVIVQHLWETQRGRMGGPRVGGMDDSMSNLAGGGRGYAIPNAALELLGPTPPVVA